MAKLTTVTIHIEAEEANKKLDELIEKANQLKATLKECGITADSEKKRNDISGISVTLGDNLKLVFRNIRAECARNSLTIEELSNKLGIERRTFYNWEEKKDLPTSYLVKMANIFRVSTDTILGLPRTEVEHK